jgi:hypothetical protein
MRADIMPKATINFIGETYNMPSRQLNAQRALNWYISGSPTGKFPTALISFPGLDVFAEVPSKNQVRGQFRLHGILYAAIQDKFYSFDSNGNYNELGTLQTSVGNVRIIANDFQLFITDGEHGYVYQITKSDTRKAGDFFVIEEATSLIGSVTFDGSGTDDMEVTGTYIGSETKNYVVQIDATGTPDTFKWSDDGGDNFNATGVAITGNPQTLNDGITVRFENTTGHTLNDKWSFTATVNSAFYVPLIPAYQDGYGVYLKQASNIWYISSINDFSEINALDFAKSNLWPDYLTVGISIKEELWLIGVDTTEIWYDVGAEIFPFEPRTNLVIRYGCIAPYSIAAAHNNILLWLSNNEEGGRVLIMVENYAPVIVSNEAVNAAWESYTTVDDAIGGVYQWDGHIFYWITFPTQDKTWTYDLVSKKWYERCSILNNTQPATAPTREGRWRANNYSYFNGMHLFGDFESGKIYKLNRNTYDENGVYFPCERVSQNFQKDLHRIRINSVELDFQKGVGLTDQSKQGHNPTVMLQISRDDGESWGNELWRTLTKVGETRKRIKWNRLGVSEAWVFRVRITDPVYRVLMGGVIEYDDLEI